MESCKRCKFQRRYLGVQIGLLLFVAAVPAASWHRVHSERMKLLAEQKAFVALVDGTRSEIERLRRDLGQLQKLDPLNQQVLDRAIKEHESKQDYGDYSIIHLPPKGCPTGWQREEFLFAEISGARLPGCIDEKRLQNGYISFDVLLGGETFGTIVPGPPRAEKPEGPRT
jgi:hypothetical protein